MLTELLWWMAPLLEEIEPMGARRETGGRYRDIVALRVAAALTNHIELRVRGAERTHRFEIAAAEPYAWQEGGSDDDWVDSFEALRKGLIAAEERVCFFTRQYFEHFTLSVAILSEDKESLTQILIGAAVELEGGEA